MTAKIEISNFVKTEYIGQYSIGLCNFLTNNFLGQGNSLGRRRICQSFGNILGKFYEFKVSPKPQH